MTKLHVFDMDGTLLEGSACLELSRHVGQFDAVHVMEEAWGRGEFGHVRYYELLLPLWDGLAPHDVDAVFEGTPWVHGISEVWADIAERGERSAVITLSPQFFAERLLAWGVHTTHGATVEPGTAVDPAAVLTPEGKVTIVEQLLEEYGLSEDDCVAYGDSASDIPLFRRLPKTVAVNGSATIREVALASYAGSDLREAYAIGRELLTDGEPPATAQSAGRPDEEVQPWPRRSSG